jgi:4-amino-4-deoxy-L-arabinose transferase-like glycosyltransferase
MLLMEPRIVTRLAVLALAALVLVSVARLRGGEYDEGYTIFLAAGTARPDWPAQPFTAAEGRALLAGHSTAGGIAADLRRTDVHPPLYFWTVAAWRALAGESLFATRLFSVLCALIALALLGAVAGRIGVPPALAMLLCLGCYGFAYTGAIARGFALPQALLLAGTLAALRGAAPGARHPAAHHPASWGAAAGIGFGAAGLANYLALFPAGAVLLWLALRRAWATLAAATLTLALALPALLHFFLAQRASRPEQFAPFEPMAATLRLARYAAASLFGGLPLYAGAAAPAVAAALAALGLALAAALAWHWRRLATPETRALPALASLAPPAGLLFLGFVFDTTPIELRYLAFALPFLALLLAGLAAALAPRPRALLLGVLLPVQAAALWGLATRPETMQPQQATARAAAAAAGPAGLVLVPRGNDGVGIAGAVILAAPAATRLALVAEDATPAAVAALAATAPRVALALIAGDTASRAAVGTMRAAWQDDPCWRIAADTATLRVLERTCAGE